jgi:hypothetical protein
MTTPAPALGRRLTTPRAAAVAGVVFAVLLATSTVLLRLSVPPVNVDSRAWIASNEYRIDLALWLIPFAGISFLWFIGVIRDRLGDREDRFFASVMFGSGLLYLAMLFVAASLSVALVRTYEAAPQLVFDSGGYEFARESAFALSNTFGIRMASVFMLSTGTIWFRSGAMQRSVVGLTYLLAIILMFGQGISLWMNLVFPLWVLVVSIHFLIVRADSDLPDSGDQLVGTR